MSKSVMLTFGEPEAPPVKPAPKPVDLAAFTREERHNNSWHVRLIGWIIGLPSVLSIAFVGCTVLWYSYTTTTDAQTWLALSAGVVVVTLFGAGLPVAAAITRDNNPGVAKVAFGFGLACIAMNFAVMAHFARHQQVPSTPSQAIARAMPADEARDLDIEISWRREALADADEHREHFDENARTWYASTQAELHSLETKRYGGPMAVTASAGAIRIPGFDLAAVSLLMLAGSALGLLISASSLAAILTEKAATVRAEAETAPAPQNAPAPLAAYHSGESADGFEHWALACISKLNGAPPLRTGEAHANYLTFCARNDYAHPLAIQEFGRRLRVWLADTHGIDGRHSNGTVFDGVALAQLGHALAAPAMNGGAV